MKKIIGFISGHGFGIMMTGFFIAIASLILFMRVRYGGAQLRTVVIAAFIAGISLYVIGRIGVAIGRKNKPLRDNNA